MGRRVVVMVMILALVTGACAGAGFPPTSTPVAQSPATTTTSLDAPPSSTSTTIAPPPSTTLSTTTSTAPPPTTMPSIAYSPPTPFVSPKPTPQGGGSGCSPGPGPLPDGVWFGFVEGTSDSSIEFDLACFRSCPHGSEGVEIVNDNSRLRTTPVDSDAPVTYESTDGPDFEESFDRWVRYEDVGLHTQVWIYVNNRTVTSIVVPDVARGCRYSAAQVEWVTKLPPSGSLAFNDLGLMTTTPTDSNHNTFYWRSDDWASSDLLVGDASGVSHTGVVGSGATVGIGATVYWWTGAEWSTETFTALGDAPKVLGTSGDRVLMSDVIEDQAVVHVLTRSANGWDSETIDIGVSHDDWEPWAGTVSGSTFAISGLVRNPSAQGGLYTNTVTIYDRVGSAWVGTATLRDGNRWDTGMWGSSLDLEGDRLVIGADGSTPGPGSPGGVYLYTRSGDTWTPQVVGEGGEGFGFQARIDGDTIVTAAAHGDGDATLWVFTSSSSGWQGTPIQVDTDDDWVYGIDILDSYVAVSTLDAVRIGSIKP